MFDFFKKYFRRTQSVTIGCMYCGALRNEAGYRTCSKECVRGVDPRLASTDNVR